MFLRLSCHSWHSSRTRSYRISVACLAAFRLISFSPRSFPIHFSSCSSRRSSVDSTVKVWDVDNGRCVITLADQQHPVIATQFSPDSEMLACAAHDRIVIWSTKVGGCRASARMCGVVERGGWLNGWVGAVCVCELSGFVVR